MAGTTGLEPATSAVTGQRSNRLSYVPTLHLLHLYFNRTEANHFRLRKAVGSLALAAHSDSKIIRPRIRYSLEQHD